MRLRSMYRAGSWLRHLRAQNENLKEAVAEAAAKALQEEVARSENISLSIATEGDKRLVGSASADDAAREFGSLERPASPWLAPLLPLARGPMRAAADAAAARTLSSLRNRKK